MSSLYTCCTLHTLPYCQRKYPCHPYTHIVRYTFTILSTQIPMSYIHTCRKLHPLPYCQSKYPCHPCTHAVHYTLYHNVNANTHVFRTHRPYTTPFTILSQQIPISSLHTGCTLYPLPYCQRQYPCHPYTQAVRYTPYHIVNATTHVIPTQMLYTTPLTILSTQIPMSFLHTCCTLYHLPYCQRKYPCHTYSHAVQYTLYHIVNANTHVIPTKIPYTTPFTILSTQIPMYSVHTGRTLHPLPYCQSKYPCHPYTHAVHYTLYHNVNANTHVFRTHRPYTTPFTILSQQIPMSSLHTGCTLYPLPYCQRQYPCHPYTQAVRYTPYHIVNATTHVIPTQMLYTTPLTILSTKIPMSSLHTCCTLYHLPYCQRKYPCHTYSHAVQYTLYHIVNANTHVIPTKIPYTTPFTILSTQIPMYSVHTGRTLHPLPYCHSNYPCHTYTHAVSYTPYHIVNATTHVIPTHRLYAKPLTILSQQIPMSSLNSGCTLQPLQYCHGKYPYHPYTQAVRYTPYHIVNATTHVIPTHRLYATPLTILSRQIPMSYLHTGCTLHPLPYCQRNYPCNPYTHAVRYTPYHIVNANTHVIPTHML